MKVETDAVLVVFWRCAEMVLRWHRPVCRSMRERRVTPATRKARRPTVGSLTAGTSRSSDEEDRSLCRDGMSAIDLNW